MLNLMDLNKNKMGVMLHYKCIITNISPCVMHTRSRGGGGGFEGFGRPPPPLKTKKHY